MFSIFLVILVVALRTSLGIGFKVKDVTLLFSAFFFFFLHFCFVKNLQNLFCCTIKSFDA